MGLTTVDTARSAAFGIISSWKYILESSQQKRLLSMATLCYTEKLVASTVGQTGQLTEKVTPIEY